MAVALLPKLLKGSDVSLWGKLNAALHGKESADWRNQIKPALCLLHRNFSTIIRFCAELLCGIISFIPW